MSSKINSLVEELLRENKIEQAPVHVEKIALKSNLSVMPTDLGPGVSGALFIDKGKATIGVNVAESRVRRRFTIAHELGHYFLHNKTSDTNNLFVEKFTFFRDENSSLGYQKKEIEANTFAATLLMPESLINKECTTAWKEQVINTEEDLVQYLSKKFDVSEIAMTYRLVKLGIIY
jgi:Zn-dependent peptidase ImmA (M78 family)